MYNKNVSEKVRNLSSKLETAKDENEFFDMVTDFYKAYGVGMSGLEATWTIVIIILVTYNFYPMIAIPIIGTIGIGLCYILLVTIAYIRNRKDVKS